MMIASVPVVTEAERGVAFLARYDISPIQSPGPRRFNKRLPRVTRTVPLARMKNESPLIALGD